MPIIRQASGFKEEEEEEEEEEEDKISYWSVKIVSI